MTIEEKDNNIYVDDIKVFIPFWEYLGGTLGEEERAREEKENKYTFKPVTQQTLKKKFPEITTKEEYNKKIVEWREEAETLAKQECIIKKKEYYCYNKIKEDLWPEISEDIIKNIKSKCERIEYDLFW